MHAKGRARRHKERALDMLVTVTTVLICPSFLFIAIIYY